MFRGLLGFVFYFRMFRRVGIDLCAQGITELRVSWKCRYRLREGCGGSGSGSFAISGFLGLKVICCLPGKDSGFPFQLCIARALKGVGCSGVSA